MAARKIQGRRVSLGHGLEVFVHPQPAKTRRGRDRIWLHIRQTDPKGWQIDEALMYVNSADLRFIKKQPPPAPKRRR